MASHPAEHLNSETKAEFKLNIQEVQRSQKPILDQNNDWVDVMIDVDGYTVVSRQQSDKYEVFDSMFERRSDFETARAGAERKGTEIALNKTVIQWDRIAGSGKYYLSRHPTTSNQMFYVGDLPEPLRQYALDMIKSGNDSVNINSQTLDQRCEIQRTYSQGLYVVFFSDDYKQFVAYQTRDAQNNQLVPRQWIRFDLNNYALEPKLPEDLRVVVESEGELYTNGWSRLSGAVICKITNTGIAFSKSDTNPASVWTDSLSGEKIACVDPTNPNRVFFCLIERPQELYELDMEGEKMQWRFSQKKFSNNAVGLDPITGMRFDPTGNFLMFHDNDELRIVEKETLQLSSAVPKVKSYTFNDQGDLICVLRSGHLAKFHANFLEVEQHRSKIRAQTSLVGLNIAQIASGVLSTHTEAGPNTADAQEIVDYPHLTETQFDTTMQFAPLIGHASELSSFQVIDARLDELRVALRARKLNEQEIAFLLRDAGAELRKKKKQFADSTLSSAIFDLGLVKFSDLTMARIQQLTEQVKGYELFLSFLGDESKRQLQEFKTRLRLETADFFKRQSEHIQKQVSSIILGAEHTLATFTSKIDFDTWIEAEFPVKAAALNELALACPPEAHEAHDAILQAQKHFREIVGRFERVFEQEYEMVRQRAVERIDTVVETIKEDIVRLGKRVLAKKFRNRSDAESFVQNSAERRRIEDDVMKLQKTDNERAKALTRFLALHLSNLYVEIERDAKIGTGATGEQMIPFGKVMFPKWEHEVEIRGEVNVGIAFEIDKKNRGAQVAAGKAMGDVCMLIDRGRGKKESIPIFEGLEHEDEFHEGLFSYRGKELSPSYVTGEEFKKIRKDYAKWMEPRSTLKAEFLRLRKELLAYYKQREKKTGKGRERKSQERTDQHRDQAWKAEFEKRLEEYSTFYQKHHVNILRRMETVGAVLKKEQFKNGKGSVPKWESHWVVDPQTEEYLEEMAQFFKMQLDLKEGILNLSGHAGTGKDVLLKIFCNMTNRPYFATDCSKWTTEFELSEDVILESVDGATTTIRMASSVLQGIQTPGAMVYFNEFTTLPIQAQTYLHSLFDEKRTMTLKTSGGKVVKAAEGVLLASSENPDYPGTNTPQLATASRRVDLPVKYPPLKRKAEASDSNKHDVFNVSEALRLARGVESLVDLTLESDLKRNAFVKLWDEYVNHIGPVSSLSPEQKFDLETIMALVQYADKLRTNFIAVFERRVKPGTNNLPVTAPVTGRELRRCAYMLNALSMAEKTATSPEAVAKDFLATFFVSKIGRADDREAVIKGMKSWSFEFRKT